MLARAEVDLGHRVASEALDDVDEQPELHTPTLHEREHLERVAPRRVLAAERLHDVGELREQQREQRPRDELGHAAAAGGRAFERTRVARLHEHGVGVDDERLEQPRDRVGSEVAEVGVEPAEEVALARVQRLPQRVALARTGPASGSTSASATTRAPAARAVSAVASVEPSSITTISSTSPRQGRWSRSAGRGSRARWRRSWPLRCAPEAHRDRVPERAFRRHEIGQIHGAPA